MAHLIKSSSMVVIVMGVTGAGKTTIGRLLAEQLGWQFADADDFHPAANVEKMRHGIPLTDDDRCPWLARLRAEIDGWLASDKNVILACSALKRSYRQQLEAGPERAASTNTATANPATSNEVRFVYLKGSAALIAERLRSRHGHFAGEAILAGQFADLEEPDDAVTVDISPTPPEIVAEIRAKLGMTLA
jgi:gluconokinase